MVSGALERSPSLWQQVLSSNLIIQRLIEYLPTHPLKILTVDHVVVQQSK
jgi:hypothetical protein